MDAYPKSHVKAAIAAAVIFLIFFATVPSREPTAMQSEPISLRITDVEPAPAVTSMPKDSATSPAAQVAVEPPPPEAKWSTFKVRNGDNMSRIFQRAGLSPRTLHEIMSLKSEVQTLRKIMPGEKLLLEITDAGELLSLRYQQSRLRNLVVSRTADGEFDAFWEIVEPEIIIGYATAEITSDAPSLYHAGKDAGLSDNIIMELSYIFQWDISFALDLRAGDVFVVMYEEHYIDGEKVKEGDIIAANFINMGREYSAVGFADESGRLQYYAPDGKSLRKAFLRDPVHFSHVSSSFNLRRLHPIHNTVMPHRGIDYAARTGTPVRASGDGKVTIARQNAASGKYIVIQHGEQYTTKYLHLSNFANGVRAGKRVNQGDVIGYVGMTGWATGPHLHYEFLVNGVHRNPRTVRLPQSDPVPPSQMPAFRAATGPLLTRLASLSGSTSFAQVSRDNNEERGEGD